MVLLQRTFIVGLLLCSSHAVAALITSHTDATVSTPAMDGSISTDEYGPGNSYLYTGGGTGFGGQLGNAAMYMKSDLSNLYIGFSNLGVAADGNQYLIYLNTRSGGFQPNGVDMDDTADGGRSNSSILSQDGTEFVTFDDGTAENADFALLLNNRDAGSGGFVVLFELSGAGTSHQVRPSSGFGLGTGDVEIELSLADLGMASGGTVEFVAVDISETGFLSNEGLPDPGIGSNPGFNNGNTTTYTDFHRFTTRSVNSFTGITERKENVTLNFPQNAPTDAAASYELENAFPNVTFAAPIAVIAPPGETNRLFVLERSGTIVVITNLASPSKTTFMTVDNVGGLSSEGGLLGLALHPNFASNRQFFLFYTPVTNNGTGSGLHTRVSRFERDPLNENLGLLNSEAVLFSQFNSAANHNGGDIHFGSDGYLYIATGDEGGASDNLNNGQRIDKDFFSALLRIDVDMKPGSLQPNHHPALNGATNYAIPPDNPFVGYTNTTYYGTAVNPANVRTEFFATGLRNPFRFHIDKPANQIYVADVGQNAWEEVNLVTNGGNYGWAAREGFAPGPKNFGVPASSYADPILSYARGSETNQGRSITGGVVYRGDRFPELLGKYIYADYVSGNIWALTHNGVTNTSNARITGEGGIVGFGADPSNGDVLLCDINSSQIKRLVQSAGGPEDFPQTLAEAGIFADIGSLTPYEGIVPYTINLPFWSDNGIKSRWFSVPSTNLFLSFDPDNDWVAPTTTVWIKHFDLQLTSGVPSSARRIETRVMVKNNTPDGGYGVTYRWGSSTNNAVLVPDGGLNEEFLINDSGIIRTQIWRYPSRAECLSCHNAAAGFALSFNTPQLNTANDFGDLQTNQIAAFDHAGYFANEVESLNLLRKLAHPTNEEYSVSYRVRSYLEANCANCHFPGGPTPTGFDTRLLTPLSDTDLINGILNDSGGNPSNRVIVRGNTAHSMLLSRISVRGAGQMPPIGSNLIDTQNIALVTAWITGEATDYETFEEWQLRHFGSTVSSNALPHSDPDGDGGDNRYEYISRTQPTNPADIVAMDVSTDGAAPSVSFWKTAGAGLDLQVTTDLVDGVWTSLDTPENAPVFEAVSSQFEIPDHAATNLAERYYRINAYEP